MKRCSWRLQIYHNKRTNVLVFHFARNDIDESPLKKLSHLFFSADRKTDTSMGNENMSIEKLPRKRIFWFKSKNYKSLALSRSDQKRFFIDRRLPVNYSEQIILRTNHKSIREKLSWQSFSNKFTAKLRVYYPAACGRGSSLVFEYIADNESLGRTGLLI